MTIALSNTLAPPSRNLEGILCVEIGMVMFVAQDGLMKSLLGPFPIWNLMIARTVVAVLILAPTILWLGFPHRLLTPLWPLHLARAALFSIGFLLFYTAFPLMGLADVSTIFFAAPLITALLAAVFLGETVGPHRIAALSVGFAGVVIAINPTAGTFKWVAILPLLTALTYALSQIIARRIGERETTLTTGFYTLAFSGVLLVPADYLFNTFFDPVPTFHHLRWEWPALDMATTAQLAFLGAIGTVGYMMLSRAYQVASASLVAPFDYTYLPFATLMAYLVWGEVPGQSTLTGMALIVGAGLYLGYRELRTVRVSPDPAPVAEATFAPGNPYSLMAQAEDTIAALDDGRATRPDLP